MRAESADERTTIAVRNRTSYNYVRVRIDESGSARIYDGPTDATTLRGAMAESGYLVARRVVAPAICDAVVEAFAAEIKPSNALFPRHQGGQATRHELDEFGQMRWGMTNVHLLDRLAFPRFVAAVLELVTDPLLTSLVSSLFEEPGKLVNTMFFEGNQFTHCHQDSWYKDSHLLGRGIACWVALEDIHPGAGRFFVCPGSQVLDFWPIRSGEVHESADVQRYFDEREVRCVAPALTKGDVLVWSALTLHGSLETWAPERSRLSMTAHFVPRSHRYLYLRREATARYETVRGVDICQTPDEELLPDPPIR